MSLTQSTFDSLSNILFLFIFFGFITVPTLWLFLTLTTPKIIMKKYFKPPHYTYNETQIMDSFPLSFIRTAIFSWITVFPSLGRKRKMEDIRKHMPTWYRLLVTLWVAIVTPSMIVMFGGILFLSSVDIVN